MLKLVNANDRIQVMDRNKMVAFVQDDRLFVIDPYGMAIEKADINHRSEIIGKYSALSNKNVSVSVRD